MTEEIEDRLRAALHRRAEGDVDRDTLLARSVHRGLRRVRRHRLAVTGAVAATGAVLVAAPMGLVRGGLATPGTPTPGVTRSVRPPGPLDFYPRSLPAAPGTVGALSQPRLVGTDPATVHFGLGALPVGVSSTAWSVEGGVETADLTVVSPDGSPGALTVALTQQGTGPTWWPPAGELGGSRPVLVGREPGELWLVEGTVYVRWRPATGLAAFLRSSLSEVDTLTTAVQVRFTTASGCRVPLRFGATPAGSRLLACSVRLGGDDPSAEVTLGTDTGSVRVIASKVRTGGVMLDPSGSPLPAESGPHPGIFAPGGSEVFVLPDLDGLTVRLATHGAYHTTELFLAAQALTRAGDPDDPRTWPVTPLGS